MKWNTSGVEQSVPQQNNSCILGTDLAWRQGFHREPAGSAVDSTGQQESITKENGGRDRRQHQMLPVAPTLGVAQRPPPSFHRLTSNELNKFVSNSFILMSRSRTSRILIRTRISVREIEIEWDTWRLIWGIRSQFCSCIESYPLLYSSIKFHHPIDLPNLWMLVCCREFLTMM